MGRPRGATMVPQPAGAVEIHLKSFHEWRRRQAPAPVVHFEIRS
jgi:hypothetical protein